MKHKFLILASAIALVSCTSEIFDNVTGSNTSMDNTIKVNAMIGNNVATRAVATLPADTSTTSAQLKSFSLTAWNAGAASFTDVTFTKDNEGNFVSDGSQYWATGQFAFVAWANNNAVAAGSEILKNYNATADGISGKYGIPAYAFDGTNQPVQQDDPVLAVNCTEKPENGNTVDLKFQHILSRISINICAPYYSDSTVCLLDFGFNDVDTAGTFTCKYPKAAGVDSSITNTDDRLPKACWSATTKAAVGEYGNDSNDNYWWLGEGLNKATVLPKTISGDSKFAPAPWLNVIPGDDVASNLQIRFQYKNAQTSAWVKKTVQVSLSVADVSSYEPGKQYVYNVQMLGQNIDDAETDTAKVQIVSVEVQDWSTSSLWEHNTSNIGIGKSLQDLIDEIESGTGYGTINLAEDFTLYDSVVVHTPKSGKSSDITINLNGYNITAVDALENMFKVENGAKLTFIETGRTSGSTTTYGSIVGANQETIFKVEEGGYLTVESGDYKFKKSGTDSTGIVISTASGADKVSVTGGTFTSGSEDSPFVVTEGTSGSVTGILKGGTYIGGYSPVPYPGIEGNYTVAQGYTSINTSATSPVTWKVVINGESFSINLTQPSVTDVTAD